jgi:hypothetical protein
MYGPKKVCRMNKKSATAKERKPGLPDFSWSKHTKTGKIYQMNTNNTKWPLNIPKGRKIFQMVIKYANSFHFKTLQNVP